MDHRLLLVIGFTVIIHMIYTLGYSVRLAGVRTQRLALAFSLWNVIYLVSSTANTIQAPFLGRIIDEAGRKVHLNAAAVIAKVGWDLRLVLLAATLGTILGAVLMPSFVRLFTRGIFLFERVKSVPKMMAMLLHPRMVKNILSTLKLPKVETMKRVSKTSGVPRKLIFLNFVVTGIWTTGVLSALYAGIVDIAYVRTTANMSGVINGIATILGVLLVDPHVASITDEAARGIRSDEDVKSLSMYLALSRVAGTVLAQLILYPAALVIVGIAKVL